MTDNTPLTEAQETRIREIIISEIEEFWTGDAIKCLARTEAEETVNQLLENTIAAKVAGLVEHDPAGVMDQLFQESGMRVRTKSSEYFDGIIGDLLKDEESGIPGAIQYHVKLHLTELVQNAISGIVAGMVANYMQNNADALANASRQMIENAFKNASIRSY